MDQFLTINGAKVHTNDTGGGFPLVFVHAGIADSRMWDDQIKAFSQDYRVVTYDMRGYGQSPPAKEEFSHYEDLTALLDALHIERCVLVGCSKGGGVAMDAALAAPEKVAGLVISGGIAHGLELESEKEFKIPQYWEEAVAAFKADDLETAAEMEVRVWVDGFNQPVGRAAEAIREKVRMMDLIALQNEKKAPEGLEKVMEPKAGTRLNEFNMPVLFLCGSLDDDEIQVAHQEMAAKMPKAELMILDGLAHMPNMEAPTTFNAILLDFVQGVTGKA
ncbi:MAG TPA: alpha/beta hydrolase [Anaerolineales bacterium]|nr:alpha/beta hydrolase [Anaerolineales bacterium]